MYNHQIRLLPYATNHDLTNPWMAFTEECTLCLKKVKHCQKPSWENGSQDVSTMTTLPQPCWRCSPFRRGRDGLSEYCISLFSFLRGYRPILIWHLPVIVDVKGLCLESIKQNELYWSNLSGVTRKCTCCIVPQLDLICSEKEGTEEGFDGTPKWCLA